MSTISRTLPNDLHVRPRETWEANLRWEKISTRISVGKSMRRVAGLWVGDVFGFVVDFLILGF
jgi:hypothetical protein